MSGAAECFATTAAWCRLSATSQTSPEARAGRERRHGGVQEGRRGAATDFRSGWLIEIEDNGSCASCGRVRAPVQGGVGNALHLAERPWPDGPRRFSMPPAGCTGRRAGTIGRRAGFVHDVLLAVAGFVHDVLLEVRRFQFRKRGKTRSG